MIDVDPVIRSELDDAVPQIQVGGGDGGSTSLPSQA